MTPSTMSLGDSSKEPWTEAKLPSYASMVVEALFNLKRPEDMTETASDAFSQLNILLYVIHTYRPEEDVNVVNAKVSQTLNSLTRIGVISKSRVGHHSDDTSDNNDHDDREGQDEGQKIDDGHAGFTLNNVQKSPDHTMHKEINRLLKRESQDKTRDLIKATKGVKGKKERKGDQKTPKDAKNQGKANKNKDSKLTSTSKPSKAGKQKIRESQEMEDSKELKETKTTKGVDNSKGANDSKAPKRPNDLKITKSNDGKTPEHQNKRKTPKASNESKTAKATATKMFNDTKGPKGCSGVKKRKGRKEFESSEGLTKSRVTKGSVTKVNESVDTKDVSKKKSQEPKESQEARSAKESGISKEERNARNSKPIKEVIDEIPEDVEDDSISNTSKKTKKKTYGYRPKRNKPKHLSPEVSVLCDNAQNLPHSDVVRQVWRYIKKHSLQDDTDRRVIRCDEKLRAVMRKRSVMQHEVIRLLANHLTDAVDLAA